MNLIQGAAAVEGKVRSRGRAAAWLWWLAPVALFAGSLASIHPILTADTPVYCTDVAQVLDSQAPASSLWESGHILWRPLGYVLYPVFALIPDDAAWTPMLKLWRGFTAINVLSGLLAALLIYALCRRMAGSLIALIPTALFAWGYSILMYSRSGTAYVPGLALLVTGLWWQLQAPSGSRKAVYGPAILFGLAALVWLPYIIAIPAACCTRRFVRFPDEDPSQPRMTWTRILAAAITAGLVVAIGVTAAALLAGVDSLPGALAWLTAAGHGMRQNRQALRAVTGSSRLFLDLGWDGVYLKRFVFHDPYNPVSAAKLIGYSLWKIACFYVFNAAVFWLAWRSRAGRGTLAPLAMVIFPNLFAAIVVFEPSSPERYLPVLPFLMLTVAAGLANPRAPRLAWAVVCLFTLALPAMNYHGLIVMYRDWHRQVIAQANGFRAIASQDDMPIVVNIQEPLEQLGQHPFDPLNRSGRLNVFWAVSEMDANARLWPVRVARYVLDLWSHGNAAWVEKLALADTPADSLLWVEGDNPQLHWRDVPAFFRRLDFDRDTGGADGFLRIARSAKNEALFRSLAQ